MMCDNKDFIIINNNNNNNDRNGIVAVVSELSSPYYANKRALHGS